MLYSMHTIAGRHIAGLLVLAIALVVFTGFATGQVANAAPADADAHSKLTDGIAAPNNPTDPGWLTLFADSLELPKTTFDLDEFSFWGLNAPHTISPVRNVAQFEYLKQGNIRGVRYDFLWATMQPQGPNSFSPGGNGAATDIGHYVANGFTVTGLLGYTPAWSNGMRPRYYPPNLPVEEEVLTFTTDTVEIGNNPVFTTEPDSMPIVVTPEVVQTQRYFDEVATTNFTLGLQPRALHNPVVVGTEEVWVDYANDNPDQGWVLFSPTENLINSPDGAEQYEFDRSGRAKFRDNRYYYYHGKTPANGSDVKLSYDAVTNAYTDKIDYLVNGKDGTITRLVGDFTGFKTQENFDSSTLDPAWQWMNEPAVWNINTTTAGNLRYQPDTAATGVGNFLYQSLVGDGDFTTSIRIQKSPTTGNTQTGIMIYQDANNWLRFALTGNLGRPYLTRSVDGVVSVSGTNGEFGQSIVAPRWLTIRRHGTKITVFTSTANPQVADQFERTVQQTLNFPLKVGISSVGTDASGVDIDQFQLRAPSIPAGATVRVSYNFLDPEPFVDFCKLIVNEFKDRIKFWEIYNEPDQSWTWRGGQEIYSILLREASKAIREADPDAKVMNGGYADSATYNIATIYQTIGNEWFDYVAWHPYLFSNKSPDALNWAYRPTNLEPRATMDANGDADKEVFFGELATGSGVLGLGGGLNDWKQSEYGFRLMLWARKLGWVKAIQWFPGIDIYPVGQWEDQVHGAHEGLFYTTGDPKPMYWTYRSGSTNKGILMDLGSYDANNNLTPASGFYPLSRVEIGAQDRGSIAQIKVLTSLTNTDITARPRYVAARHIGQAGTPPVVVSVNSISPELRHEVWTATAITPLTFDVVGSKSGIQGIATIGTAFSSLNGVVTFTIPIVAKPYIIGDKFTFETFAGDGLVESAVWNNDGSTTGYGPIEVVLPQTANARYVAIHFVKAAGANQIDIDEVKVFTTGDVNVANGKLYIVDGYQPGFNEVEVPIDVNSIYDLNTVEDGTLVKLADKTLYQVHSLFAYIEEPDRFAGIRLSGPVAESAGTKVDVIGRLGTTPGGERHLVVDSVASHGPATVEPLGATGYGLNVNRLMDGLYVKVFGVVQPGSIGDFSYVINDGSVLGTKVITQTTPTVSEGGFVIVTGAAGWDNGRIVSSD